MGTRSDFMAAMLKDFPSELADFNKYYDNFVKAMAAGCEDIAQGMLRMAHDEFTHMTYLRDTLWENGTPIPAEHEKLYQEAHAKHCMMTK